MAQQPAVGHRLDGRIARLVAEHRQLTEELAAAQKRDVAAAPVHSDMDPATAPLR